MKKISTFIFGAFLIALAVTGFMNRYPSSPADASTEVGTVKSVKVNGIGTVSVSPDTAYLYVGIDTEGATSKEAQDLNKVQAQKVIQALIDAGVDEKNIKTQYYNVYPRYDYQESSQKLIGYTASHSLRLKITDLDTVSALLDTATANGATNVGNIEYTLENKDSAYDQARKMASDNAKEKAGKLGDVFGFEVGDLLEVQEMSYDNVVFYSDMGKGGMGGGSPENTIHPGEIEITLELTAVFTIE